MDKNFDLIVKQYLKPIYNFAFRLSGNESDAADITQEAFLKVWKNIKNINSDKNLKTWIFTIARNTTIDWFRKRKNISFSKMGEGENENNFEESIEDIEPLPDEIFERKELKKELEIALSKIRPDFREIIFLHYSENMTFEEISKIVGKPLNTVKSHHLRALSALRKLLS